MFDVLMHPKIFNVVIMSLYLINSGWQGWHENYAGMCYWLSALAITATVTFGYE